MTASVLIVAGSDSCAGAGAQIDLKTAAAHGVYATCALTAVTAQNTTSVDAVQVFDPDLVVAQMEAVFSDMEPQAVKIGMLGNAEVATAVAGFLERHAQVPVVLDPVLVATAGGALTDAAAFDCIRGTLLPRAALVTPNIPEASALSGIDIVDDDGIDAAARSFLDAGSQAVLVKGGHGTGEEVCDHLYANGARRVLSARRLSGEYHGTGCSMATAIACNIACGASLVQAVELAHAYLSDALRHVHALGGGSRIFDPLNRLDRPYGVFPR